GYLSYWVGQIGYLSARQGFALLLALYTPLAPASPPATSSSAHPYPSSRLGPAPEQVWWVETDGEGELWSNGLRVLTAYETRTERRSYVRFPRRAGPPIPAGETPAGIVYHTSEGEIIPFQPDLNQEILSKTQGLLGWLRRRDTYNYFIDRFGQVYRIVIDSDIAGHAGMSIWADDDHYYLNLNDSFLGVCFETHWDPDAGDGELLTLAQIQAALSLTDMLRARYGIRDQNCVPHGLISVNPQKMLIGYHVDWAKGFPFRALGLTDKYEVPPPSMLDFGFGYDGHLIQTLNGQLWPGLDLAQRALEQRAEAQGMSLPALRRDLQNRYQESVELLRTVKESLEAAP
ncbi:MAG: N-acetylmuramoyl-L-alanine amidase, partial [Acidobacteriota bacterium]